ncbi:TonB-dependent receptor [Polaribacter sargassicola]|uniref:TonB-dependent receptor n=1 Tax=Polaribacter sargassicola TaxID=2836891 RepID=UPI001EFFCC41|nr:TonB-dependent receptor [Polaribacter sp. DS7-9]MCG1035535.1 TonB-dependent receptor [Polaribacter sp. DS7-9]
MKQFYLLKLFLLTILLSLNSVSSSAQTGNIQGLITDKDGFYVPGANITIEAIKKGDITDFDGKFTIIGVPTGEHVLKVSYLGFKNIEQKIEVKENQTTSIKLELVSESIELDVIQIKTFRFGSQSKALNTQKNNVNITNVVSTDQIGKFPDANIGDAVKRIPGITMQVDQGEARNIIVRGLSPQLNSVTLNGSRIPSAEADNRNIQMDLIPSDMIQSIQVNKAVTPDMDADALGGSVNLITRTAPQGFRLSATGGSGINTITNKRILNGSFLIGDRSKDGKFGWMVSAAINDNDFGSHDVEAEWTNEFAYTDDAGEEVEMEVNPYANVFEERTYLVQRVRRSFSANFDYKINDNNDIYFKSMYNWRDDRENRFVLENEILDGEDIEVGDFTLSGNTLSMFPVEVKRETKGGIDNNRNKNRRLEDQRMFNFTLGGNHLANKLQIDWMASYAKASEERLNERYLVYESEYAINYNNDPEFPLYTPVDADDAAFNSFEFGELTEENQYTEEKDMNVFVNFKLPLNMFDNEDGFLKFGVRGRFKNKNRDNDFFEYSPEDGTFDELGNIPTRDYTNSDYLAGSQYQVGSFATPEFLGSLDLTNASDFEEEDLIDEYLSGNFDVKENVFAGYIMANQKLSSKLSLLAGVRIESTSLESDGFKLTYVEEDEDAGIDEAILVDAVSDKNSYVNVLPGLHFKYDLNDNSVIRLAWTNTLARPNYEDLIPRAEIVNEDNEVVIGNPDLDPTTSMNFDLMAEHYFSNVGIISGGLFYKNIKDFIYTYQTETTDDTYGDDTTGYDVYQPLNGDKASIFGLELAIQRKLDFLPGFLKNFSVYANYTYLTSSADGIRNEDGEEREDLDLPNTTPNMFNASLGYADSKFNARLSGNFSDAYIDEIGGNDFEDRYYDKQFFLDFSAGYTINQNLSIYASVNNITNQPLRYYQGVSDRTMQMEYYGQRITFGLKYDLFKK